MASPGAALDGKSMLRVLRGEREPIPPLWMMRQAGRYLPEYRAIRATVPTFLDFCYNPSLAAEATLQPIRRFGFDAAILFSDILVVPDALGQNVSFETGEGPRLDPIQTPGDISKLSDAIDLGRLEPVFETIGRVKSALPGETTFLGFCGAPWTVASYMIAGRGTPDQGPARLFAYRHRDAFQQIIDKLVDASVAYLARQVEAGVDAVQIFDSWSGVLPRLEFDRWCLDPVQRIVNGLRSVHPDIPVIAFPRCAATHLERVAAVLDVNAIGLDTAVDLEWAAGRIQPLRAIQGNLDPLALIAGGAALESGVRHILQVAGGGPLIFNLGHGIQPETPVDHVEKLVKLVRQGL